MTAKGATMITMSAKDATKNAMAVTMTEKYATKSAEDASMIRVKPLRARA